MVYVCLKASIMMWITDNGSNYTVNIPRDFRINSTFIQSNQTINDINLNRYSALPPYGGRIRPWKNYFLCCSHNIISCGHKIAILFPHIMSCGHNILSCSHNIISCGHKITILFPQHNILWPQHITLFPHLVVEDPEVTD